MSFFKLYNKVHRRTDWCDLWRWERKSVMPEWYKEREETPSRIKEIFKDRDYGIFKSFPQ